MLTSEFLQKATTLRETTRANTPFTVSRAIGLCKKRLIWGVRTLICRPFRHVLLYIKDILILQTASSVTLAATDSTEKLWKQSATWCTIHHLLYCPHTAHFPSVQGLSGILTQKRCISHVWKVKNLRTLGLSLSAAHIIELSGVHCIDCLCKGSMHFKPTWSQRNFRVKLQVRSLKTKQTNHEDSSEHYTT